MQPLGRIPFLMAGLLLALLIIAADRWVLAHFGVPWTWRTYWWPLPLNPFDLSFESQSVLLALGATALPFALVGLWLCLRRLQALQRQPLLVLLFFLPGVNLLLFAYLLIAPPRATPPPEFVNQLRLADPWLAALVTALVGLAAIGLCLLGFQSYGWGVFFAIPFAMGLIASLLLYSGHPRSFGHCFGVACLAMGMVGVAMLGLAMEGVICLLMSIPIALPLAALGVFVARTIAEPGRNVRSEAMSFAIALWLSCPLTATIDNQPVASPVLHQVVSTVDVDAPPSVVWPLVIAFPELPQPREWFFQMGIAYPVRARIEGVGVGAIRYCEFSTGPFVEPITQWEPNQLLAFDVQASPAPLRELSPYDIHPPHLDGFIVSRRGQFRLIPLPGGRTRLEGTTWYELKLLPAGYWAQWTNFFIHAIHQRVLTHIAGLARKQANPVGLN